MNGVVTGGARRLRDSIELLVRLQGAGPSSGLVDRGRLEPVQELAHRMGGLPALVAELIGSYTGRPTPTSFDRPPARGRTGSRSATFPRVPGPVDRVGLDLTLARVALPLVTRRAARARLGVDLLEQLAADTAAQRRLTADHHEAITACLTRVFGDAGDVRVDDDGTVVTTTRGDRSRVSAALVHLVLEHRVVHARLRTATSVTDPTWSITRWGTARRVSPAVAELFRQVVDRPRDADELAHNWRRLGLDDDLRCELLPTVDAAVELLGALTFPATSGAPRRDEDPVAPVPDELGTVYAAAHLVGLGHLAAGGGPPGSCGSTATNAR